MYDTIKSYLLSVEPLTYRNLKTNHQEFLLRLEDATQFITDWVAYDKVNLSPKSIVELRVFCVFRDIAEIPKTCSVCGNAWHRLGRTPTYTKGATQCFITECSVSCRKKSSRVIEKTKRTMIDRYGVENPSQSAEIQQRKTLTSIANFGVANPAQSPEVQRKVKQTLESRYGVDNAMKCPVIRKKAQSTNLEKYGQTNPGQVEEFRKKQKQTNFERYGVEHASQSTVIKDKTKQTNLERYGVEWTTQHQPTRYKQKHTNLERYGAETPFQSEIVRHKANQTLIQRYGVDNPSSIPSSIEKSRSTAKLKYGVEWASQRNIPHHILQLLDDSNQMQSMLNQHKSHSAVAHHLNVSLTTVLMRSKLFDLDYTIANTTSVAEMQIIQIINDLGIECEQSNRTILDGKELDIFIPSHNIAIEFNGIYWHSTKFKDKHYHQQKALSCMEKGIQLISIWEDDWNNETKRTILIDKIKSKLNLNADRVFARKCAVKEMCNSDVKKFLNHNHIQGFVPSSLNLALLFEGEIVAVLGLIDKREGKWYLSRSATSKTVVGGFSKLLSFFKLNYDWDEIATFAHLDYSHGNVYEKNGFIKSHITTPGLFYVVGSTRVSRHKFMKHKLPSIFGDSIDMSLSADDILIARGIYPIYDCGSISFTLHR